MRAWDLHDYLFAGAVVAGLLFLAIFTGAWALEGIRALRRWLRIPTDAVLRAEARTHLAEIAELRKELATVRKLNVGLAERCARQSELLTQKAMRPSVGKVERGMVAQHLIDEDAEFIQTD